MRQASRPSLSQIFKAVWRSNQNVMENYVHTQQHVRDIIKSLTHWVIALDGLAFKINDMVVRTKRGNKLKTHSKSYSVWHFSKTHLDIETWTYSQSPEQAKEQRNKTRSQLKRSTVLVQFFHCYMACKMSFTIITFWVEESAEGVDLRASQLITVSLH